MKQINTLFATPVYRKVLDKLNFNDSIEQFILQSETLEFEKPNPPQGKFPNLFESKFDLFKHDSPVIQQLKQVIYSELAQFIAEINNFKLSDLENLMFYNDSWFHITRNGGYFQPHNHPLASWSVVYCVSPGDKIPSEDKQAGHLVFMDSRAGSSMFLDPTNRTMSRAYSYNGYRVRLQAKELIIFPSYLNHYVEPYLGKEERITIAANFWFHNKR